MDNNTQCKKKKKDTEPRVKTLFPFAGSVRSSRAYFIRFYPRVCSNSKMDALGTLRNFPSTTGNFGEFVEFSGDRARLLFDDD